MDSVCSSPEVSRRTGRRSSEEHAVGSDEATAHQLGAAHCAERREALWAELRQLDRDLDESEEGLKLCPSKADKLTAANYHACFRFLHMALDRCERLQDQAAALESRDGSAFGEAAISTEYAILAVEIVARHDRAHRLL